MNRLLTTAALAAALAVAACGTSPSAPAVTATATTASAPAAPPAAPPPPAPRAAAPGPGPGPAAPAPAMPGALPGGSLPPAVGADAPPQACLDVLDQLSRGIPTEETGPALRARGLRIRTPIVVDPALSGQLAGISGARVRLTVDAKGAVVPGSLSVQQRHGDPKLAEVLPAAVTRSLSFDTRQAQPAAPASFPFTTVYVACTR